jgi:aspartokinase
MKPVMAEGGNPSATDAETAAGTERLAVGGIKLSTPLVLIRWETIDPQTLESMFERLTSAQINLPVVLIDAAENAPCGMFCIDASEIDRARPILQTVDGIRPIAPVVAVSVYPFGKRLTLLGKILQAFAERALPIYAVGSSLASLVVLTDHDRRKDCLDSLLDHVSLPENHAPFEPEFQVRYQERS